MPWIGVDLDGTLAHYEEWGGIDEIGKPVPQMLLRVKEWIKQGKKVKIFTARASRGEAAISSIKEYLKSIGLPDLEITNKKDFAMIELWDDRAVCVETNTGRVLGRPK